MFLRNQGVGSWELNLAAFLADLNTNQWYADPITGQSYYDYEPFYVSGPISQGRAFDDALSLLNYRYGSGYLSLLSAKACLANTANYPFYNDGYSDGPLQITWNTNLSLFPDDLTLSWPGADNPNHFYTINDLFDFTKSSVGFTNRLRSVGNGVSSYDRYTYFRLLDELGTDSTMDGGKLNINYSNALVLYSSSGAVTNISIVSGAETNLLPWQPLDFFHAAADKLLRTYTTNWYQASPSNFLATYYGLIPPGYLDANGVGVTNVQYLGQTNEIPSFGVMNIPVYVNGQFVYSPAVNRLLQLAANIYDSATNSPYPSVFRPLFLRTNQFGFDNVYVIGYQRVADSTRTQLGGQAIRSETPITEATVDVTDSRVGQPSGELVNVYGVPWILGAKKGFPSFNQLSLFSGVQFARKLQITRDSVTTFPANYTTNQMYAMSIGNNLGLSFWNSYNNTYPRPLTVYASDTLYVKLTNGANTWFGWTNFTIPSVTINSWPGAQWTASTLPPAATPKANSFYNVNWAFTFEPPSVYHLFNAQLDPIGSPTAQQWDNIAQLPQFGLLTTNYLQAAILDGTQVIDYVQLRDPINAGNVNQALADPNYPDDQNKYYQWSTNLPPGAPITAPNYGIFNQIIVSMNPGFANALKGNSWVSPSPSAQAAGLTTPAAESAFFGGFFNPTFQYAGVTYKNLDLTVQVPYTPARTIFTSYLLQANDPFVHYLAADLGAPTGNTAVWYNGSWKNGWWYQSDDPVSQPLPLVPPTPIKGRYQPWGQSAQMARLAGVDTNGYNLSYKDPIVWGPDNWDFPTNVYPAIGWIGRVHRGTPWQTVYLKSNDLLTNNQVIGNVLQNVGVNTWAQWTGDVQTGFNQYYFDAVNSAPVWDRLLFDIFTTRFNDNAVRGTLSVNQTHLPAWSAVFSGMNVLSNINPNPHPSVLGRPATTYFPINPAGIFGANSALGTLVSSINQTRSQFPNAGFAHAGSILAAPALTEYSPFLNLSGNQRASGISDELYEWIPQQMMGLVRYGDPRYVLYCYGQALRPAPNAMVTAGNYFGMYTNYQVVAETAVRAVIKVDKHIAGNGTNYSTSVKTFNVLPAD